jgi:hypothetical protein
MAKHSKEKIIIEIKRVAQKLNTKKLTKKEFIRNSGISLSVIRYYFENWNAALIAAGLEIMTDEEKSLKIQERQTIDDNVLLVELLRVYYKSLVSKIEIFR